MKIKLLQVKENFLPFHQIDQKLQKKLQNTANTLHELDNVIKEDIKGSCLWEMMDGRSISRKAIKNKEEVQCPTLLELAQKYSAAKGNKNTTEFYKSVLFAGQQIFFVKNNTIEQSQSDYWFSYR